MLADLSFVRLLITFLFATTWFLAAFSKFATFAVPEWYFKVSRNNGSLLVDWAYWSAQLFAVCYEPLPDGVFCNGWPSLFKMGNGKFHAYLFDAWIWLKAHKWFCWCCKFVPILCGNVALLWLFRVGHKTDIKKFLLKELLINVSSNFRYFSL